MKSSVKILGAAEVTFATLKRLPEVAALEHAMSRALGYDVQIISIGSERLPQHTAAPRKRRRK